MQNNLSLGTIKEELAADYLEKNEISVLTRNYRCRYGEIDIIAKDGEYLVFVEVKYRKDLNKGYPQEAVTIRKQKTIAFVANYYIMQHNLELDTPIRFDVIAILGEEITHIKNAFSAI